MKNSMKKSIEDEDEDYNNDSKSKKRVTIWNIKS